MWRGCAIVCVMVGGCLVDEVDAAPDGVFACEVDDDCEAGQFCVQARCHAEAPPRLEVRSPEIDQIVLPRPDDPADQLTVAISVGGENLVLVDPSDSAEPVVGEGVIEIWVDGELLETVTSGNVVSGAAAEVTIPATPGVHRILARALLSDGTRYDNDEARATRVFWIDDGNPHVAVVSPWPGDVFSLEETDVDVEVASLNFPLFPATDLGPDPSGHTHIHYDDVFPECVDEPSCDCCYIGILGPMEADQRRAKTVLRLPPSAAAQSSITAVLRQTNHLAFETVDGEYVFDTVPIERREIAPAAPTDRDPGGSTGG